MKIRNIAIVPCAVAVLAACTVNEPEFDLSVREGVEIKGDDVPEEARVSGKVNMHVTPELARDFENATDEDGCVRLEQTKAAGTCIVRLRRLFPYAGEFEPRTRAAGLHLWYVAEYDETLPVSKTSGSLSNIEGVDMLEYPVRTVPLEISDEIVYVNQDEDAGVSPYAVPDASTFPRGASGAASFFNDPRLGSQWHYYNDGSVASSASGCDINVLPVWKSYTTGSKDVIVAVVDGGVDYTHEDLAANMWENPKQRGTCGRNFVRGDFNVTADSHGTHVAGTVAAVNNNGKGVCGVAGGDAAKKVAGVRIMSCQIFEGDKDADGAAAIKWACDNGAVIAQNSWGYTVPMSIPSSLEAAIKYFVDNAGTAASGAQTGPIKGGIVVFAAGNENSIQPHGTNSQYAIVVSSVGADYRRAYYSNYGSWVSIAAPGGDAKKGNQVLSTLPGNKYGYYQGTSMACPHVSGVVALAVSYLKGTGVTAAQIKERILKNTTSISSFNPTFDMGKGLVNCYKAIAGTGGAAPMRPSSPTAEVLSNNVDISVPVPLDSDDGTPSVIRIYYSTSDFTSVTDKEFASFYVGDLKAGETLSGSISGLEFDTKYYLAAQALDLAENASALSPRIQVTTGLNIPPSLSVSAESLEFKAHLNPAVNVEIANPARHFYYIDLKRQSAQDSLAIVLDTLVREKPVIRVKGALLAEGTHSAVLKVTDVYGAFDQRTFSFTVLPNSAPYKGKDLPDVVFGSRNADAVSYEASEYFCDDDGEVLKYSFENDGAAANFMYQNGKFILTPMDYGYSTIKVTGTDVRGASISQSFRVLVRNAKVAVDVYPNPVSSTLYFRTGNAVEETTRLKIKVISPVGQTYFEGEKDVSVFEPFALDMKGAAAGIYNVTVECGGEICKYNIAKI